MNELISSGIATKILAQISPRTDKDTDDMVKEWAASSIFVETIPADLSTTTGVESVVSAAKSSGVGSVIFAASGGVDNCELIENIALEKLLNGLQAQIQSDSIGLFDFPKDVNSFRPLDDVVMGGRSSSKMVREWNSNHATFTGNVTTEGGGGFAQTRAPMSASLLAEKDEDGTTTADSINLSEYDGISIRICGDGTMRNYKLNLKDEATQSIPAFAYQAMFSVEGTTLSLIHI